MSLAVISCIDNLHFSFWCWRKKHFSAVYYTNRDTYFFLFTCLSQRLALGFVLQSVHVLLSCLRRSDLALCWVLKVYTFLYFSSPTRGSEKYKKVYTFGPNTVPSHLLRHNFTTSTTTSSTNTRALPLPTAALPEKLRTSIYSTCLLVHFYNRSGIFV